MDAPDCSSPDELHATLIALLGDSRHPRGTRSPIPAGLPRENPPRAVPSALYAQVDRRPTMLELLLDNEPWTSGVAAASSSSITPAARERDSSPYACCLVIQGESWTWAERSV